MKESPIRSHNSYCPCDCKYFRETTFDHKCRYYEVMLQEGPITHATPRCHDCKWTDPVWVDWWHPDKSKRKKHETL